MARPSVVFDDETWQKLEKVAAAENREPGDVVQTLVARYLAEREMSEAEWQARFEKLVQDFRAGVPPDATPEEIEADITLAREEVRRARRARRR